MVLKRKRYQKTANAPKKKAVIKKTPPKSLKKTS